MVPDCQVRVGPVQIALECRVPKFVDIGSDTNIRETLLDYFPKEPLRDNEGSNIY